MLRTSLWIGRPVTLQFRHADYQQLDLQDFIGDKLYLAKMIPTTPDTNAAKRSDVIVSSIQVRYSIKTTTTANVGSAVQAFEVANIGNMPCAKRASMLARRKMESCDGLEDSGRRREQ